ncbi:MAG: tRNA pseudouridine(55) synthase TruB [Anaerolineae bacterium]|nr:tRNA pseudouridine(55) synthase TruB [Anaerolineae bacterium]
MSPDSSFFGLLNINKPSGPTSHDVVARVRRSTRVRKIGHAGTLDPLASGVLVLCLGQATRLSEYVMRSRKTYRALVRFGVTTDTYDADGEVLAERSADDLTPARVEAALAPFRGEIAQVPPPYSAIKRDGKKLYELARAGEVVQAEPRPVTIYRLAVTGMALPDVTLEVECSPGTYIRSLAHDLGQALGVGAYLAGLVRAASGLFRIEEAVPLDVFEAAVAAGSWRDCLLPPDLALQDLPAVHLDAAEAQRIQHGNTVPAPSDATSEARAYDPTGRLLALITAGEGVWRPLRVFPPD